MLIAVNILILLYLVAPVIVVVATAFTTTAYPVFPPQGFTLQWFERFLGMPEFTEAIRRSTLLALSSTTVATVLGTFSALSLARYRFSGREAISAFMLSPILFPTIVFGLALLVFYSRIGLSGSFAGLVIAPQRADDAFRHPACDGELGGVRSRRGGGEPQSRGRMVADVPAGDAAVDTARGTGGCRLRVYHFIR